ncbi:MAG: class I poly(R)-hydroxyalkanoic acid synthase, partial [Alphaproteobacteria bacterium]|nr:class I poly(R)-hydroxyalkanoic acid synthase [Alphaproteobacteria bacterium]
MSDHESEKTPQLDELKENFEKIDALTKRLIAIMAQQKAEQPEQSNVSTELFFKAASSYFAQMMNNPAKLIESQVRYYKASIEAWSDFQVSMMGAAQDAKVKDRRFRDDAWQTNPYFNMIKQQYLLSSEVIKDSVAEIEGLSEGEARQIQFFSQQLINFLSPQNFLGTNPEALKHAIETQGKSLVEGLENLVNDLEKGDGQLSVSLTDVNAFTVGENLATSDGRVVFRNRLFELIYYQPTTDTVFERPLLIVPPCINKFYILDLTPQNSFIQFALAAGQGVFLMSWVNPDGAMADIGFEDYMTEGVQTALEQVTSLTGQVQTNVIGYCIGGTLVAVTADYLKKIGHDLIYSATFFTTLTDFHDPGELAIYTGPDYTKKIHDRIAESGLLDGTFLSQTFSFLRSGDLVYGPAVRSYLMGQKPPVMDLLYWNSDSTNLPGRMATEYLENFYQQNRFALGSLRFLNTDLSLSDLDLPICAVAA